MSEQPQETQPPKKSRRAFLKGLGLAGAGFVAGRVIPKSERPKTQEEGPWEELGKRLGPGVAVAAEIVDQNFDPDTGRMGQVVVPLIWMPPSPASEALITRLYSERLDNPKTTLFRLEVEIVRPIRDDLYEKAKERIRKQGGKESHVQKVHYEVIPPQRIDKDGNWTNIGSKQEEQP